MNKKILDIVNDVDFILFDMSLEQRGIIFTMLLQHINDKPINTDSDLFVGADENDLSISMAVYRMIVYMAEK